MDGFTFRKEERLSSQKIIGDIFTSGESFLAYPLKVVFLKTNAAQAHPAQAAFTVSKRNFKLAVKRNLLKRCMREAYRLNKAAFYEELANKSHQIAIVFVFIGKEVAEYSTIEKGMKSALKKTLVKLNAEEAN